MNAEKEGFAGDISISLGFNAHPPAFQNKPAVSRRTPGLSTSSVVHLRFLNGLTFSMPQTYSYLASMSSVASLTFAAALHMLVVVLENY
jgi:hypothetical protein